MNTLSEVPRRHAISWTGPAILLGSLVMLMGLAGCASETGSAAEVSQATVSAGDDIPPVLATVGDEKITMEDIRSRVGGDLDGLEINYQLARHKLIETTLNQMMRERVLVPEAQRQGKNVEELVMAEAGPSVNPTDVEVAAWYDENKARLGERTIEQVRTQIIDYLRKQRLEAASEKLEHRLNEEHKVTVFFKPYRVPLDNQAAPALGPANAVVTLTEFSDFQCPYCGGFFPTLKQLEKNFGDKLRVVYRQYPLQNLHPNAQKAAEASLCANEQDKFWELHDLMFQEQDKLSVKELKEKAARLGLDQKKFDTCLDSGRYVERIQEDQKEGLRVGINGTPAIFLNGIPLEGGAVSYDAAAKAIQRAIEVASR